MITGMTAILVRRQASTIMLGMGGVSSPSRDLGSLSVQEKPEVRVGRAPLLVRVAFTDMAKPGMAAQLSLTGRMSVWMKRPPDWEKMLSLQ